MAAIGFQCSVCISVERIYTTTPSLVFLSFTRSLPPSFIPLRVAPLTSIQFSLMGFIDMKFDMCHPSMLRQKLINLSINQDANLLSTSSSLLLLPICLPHFLSFHCPICYWLFFDTDTTDSPSTLPFLFSLPFFYHQPSLCVSGAWHALCLFNCHGLGRIEEDEDGMGWGGQCRERLKEWGRVEWQNLLTFLPSSLAVSPKGEDSKWVMGQFLVGTNIARALLCFNEPGSQDYIYSNRLGLRFQNVLGIHLMAFC